MEHNEAHVDKEKEKQEQRIRDFLLSENVPADTARKFAGELVRRVVPKPPARKRPLTARELFQRDTDNANSLDEIYTAVVMHTPSMLKCGDVGEIEHCAHLQIDNIDVHDQGHPRQHDSMAFFIYTCAYLNLLMKNPRKTFPFYTLGDPITNDARLPQWFLNDINVHATARLLKHFLDTVFKHCVGNTHDGVEIGIAIHVQKHYNVDLINRGFHNNSKLPKWMR